MIQRRQAVLVGLDNLGFCIFQQLRAAQIDVTVINREAGEFDREVQQTGAKLQLGNLRDKQLLIDAGIGRAQTLIIGTNDDTTNLVVALNALELNPQIQIVLRHFNLNLAREIEASIPNSKVLSPDSISASAFAVAAHTPNSFLSFSYFGRIMTFFTIDTGEHKELEGQLIGSVERSWGMKVVAVNSERERIKFPEPEQPISVGANLVAFGPLDSARRFGPRRDFPQVPARAALEQGIKQPGWRYLLNSNDPILAYTVAAAIMVLSLGTIFFMLAEHYTGEDALIFVLNLVTLNGYSEFPLKHGPWYSMVIAHVVWIAGIVLTAIMFALITNAIMAKRMDILMGRSPVRKSGHVVICGLGAAGMRIMEELVKLGEQVVVIESNAENKFIEHARSLDVPLIIADANAAETLRFANVRQARCLISSIEDDMLNLEIGLGARAMNPYLHIILRIHQLELTRQLTKRFNIHRTYSPANLAAPSFVSPALGDAENVLTTLELDDKPHAVIEKMVPEFVDFTGGQGMTLKDVFGAKEMFILGLVSADGKVLVSPSPDAPVQKGDRVLYVKRAMQRTWSLIGKAGQQSR